MGFHRIDVQIRFASPFPKKKKKEGRSYVALFMPPRGTWNYTPSTNDDTPMEILVVSGLPRPNRTVITRCQLPLFESLGNVYRYPLDILIFTRVRHVMQRPCHPHFHVSHRIFGRNRLQLKFP